MAQRAVEDFGWLGPGDMIGAPYVERLRGNHALSAALTGITAAVVGVIANLGLYFALHTFFDDDRVGLSSLDPTALAIGVVAAVLLFWLRWPVLRVLGACALLGVAVTLVD